MLMLLLARAETMMSDQPEVTKTTRQRQQKKGAKNVSLALFHHNWASFFARKGYGLSSLGWCIMGWVPVRLRFTGQNRG